MQLKQNWILKINKKTIQKKQVNEQSNKQTNGHSKKQKMNKKTNKKNRSKLLGQFDHSYTFLY